MSAALPHRIDPVDCGCTDCGSGWSQPFRSYGDPLQFQALMHGDVTDGTGDGDRFGWMELAAECCPQEFGEWVAGELRGKRLLSRRILQAKAAGTVLGSLLDE